MGQRDCLRTPDRDTPRCRSGAVSVALAWCSVVAFCARSGAGKLHPSSEDRRHGAVTSETVAFFDTPRPDMGTAAAEVWGIHNWSPQR
jgi:hypothetical protein